MKGLFPELSQCGYEVRQVPSCLEGSLSPAFYLTAPVDDRYQNVIYINGGSTDSRKDLSPPWPTRASPAISTRPYTAGPTENAGLSAL